MPLSTHSQPQSSQRSLKFNLPTTTLGPGAQGPLTVRFFLAAPRTRTVWKVQSASLVTVLSLVGKAPLGVNPQLVLYILVGNIRVPVYRFNIEFKKKESEGPEVLSPKEFILELFSSVEATRTEALELEIELSWGAGLIFAGGEITLSQMVLNLIFEQLSYAR